MIANIPNCKNNHKSGLHMVNGKYFIGCYEDDNCEFNMYKKEERFYTIEEAVFDWVDNREVVSK